MKSGGQRAGQGEDAEGVSFPVGGLGLSPGNVILHQFSIMLALNSRLYLLVQKTIFMLEILKHSAVIQKTFWVNFRHWVCDVTFVYNCVEIMLKIL